ncbi:hypothetical protein HaLaN_30272 [Haematococcus lacustris]|uniref:Uncharacterized protein n=1 Tax=Haematococcus lacustris TaxID=44745 RepID=A0A6A0AEX0_HAELA|nr:hypothetical protein HaLaN_30272 [Haematococcus lacustris]
MTLTLAGALTANAAALWYEVVMVANGLALNMDSHGFPDIFTCFTPKLAQADKFADECLTVSALSKKPPSLTLAQKSWKSFIQTMPRTADVKLSSVEVAALGRKASTCMTIDSALLAPAPCVSAAGVNSGSKFRKGKPADDVPTLSSAKDAVSIVGQQGLVPHEQWHSTLALNLEPSLQSNTLVVNHYKTASSEKRAPLLSGRMAARHAAEVPGLTGLPPASAAQLGLTPLPRSGGMPREVVASAQDASSAARILEVVGQLAELEQERQAQAVQRALWDQRKQAHLAALAAQNASSSSFKTTSREQACAVAIIGWVWDANDGMSNAHWAWC